MNCQLGDVQTQTAGIRVVRLSGTENDFGSSSQSQFARISSNQLFTLKPSDTQDGSYEEIYVQQNVDTRSDIFNKLGLVAQRIFFIKPVSGFSFMAVGPGKSYDPQSRAFTCSDYGNEDGYIWFGPNKEFFAIFNSNLLCRYTQSG